MYTETSLIINNVLKQQAKMFQDGNVFCNISTVHVHEQESFNSNGKLSFHYANQTSRSTAHLQATVKSTSRQS